MVFLTINFNKLKKNQKDVVLAQLERRLRKVFFHEDFEKRAEVKKIIGPMPDFSNFLQQLRSIRSKYSSEGKNFHSRIFYESPLLTKSQEAHLFKKYNFFKYRAKKRLHKKEITNSIRDVNLADEVRNIIATSNLRLCVPIVKKMGEINRFDDLFSEGCDSIIKAVDCFDPNRGFKFSTYATFVLKRNLQKSLKSWRNFEERNSTCLNESGTQAAVFNHDFEVVFEQTDRLLVIKKLLNLCNEREKKVIERRFFESKKLIDIASEFGLSKERIRQIETRALEKMHRQCKRIGVSFDCF